MSKSPGWSRALPRVLVARAGDRIGTLDDARAYMLALPEGVQVRPYWQRAAELVLAAADGGDVVAATDQLALALFIEYRLDVRATPVAY